MHYIATHTFACEGAPVAGLLTRGRCGRGMGALEGLPLAEAGSAVLAGDSASPGPPLLRGLPLAAAQVLEAHQSLLSGSTQVLAAPGRRLACQACPLAE